MKWIVHASLRKMLLRGKWSFVNVMESAIIIRSAPAFSAIMFLETQNCLSFLGFPVVIFDDVECSSLGWC